MGLKHWVGPFRELVGTGPLTQSSSSEGIGPDQSSDFIAQLSGLTFNLIDIVTLT